MGFIVGFPVISGVGVSEIFGSAVFMFSGVAFIGDFESGVPLSLGMGVFDAFGVGSLIDSGVVS